MMTSIVIYFLTLLFAKDPILPVYKNIHKQGDKLYNVGDHQNALLMYKKYYNRYRDTHTAKLIADCYWKEKNYDSAFVYIQLSGDRSAENDFRCSEIYARKGNYAVAIKLIDQVLSKAGTADVKKLQLRKKGFETAMKFMRDSADWKLGYLAVNSTANETSPFIHDNELYVISNRSSNKLYPAGFNYLYRVGQIKYLSNRPNIYPGKNNFDYDRKFASDISLRSSADNIVLLPGIKTEVLPFSGVEMEKMQDVIGAVSIDANGVLYFSKEIMNKETGRMYAQICRKNSNKEIELLSVNDGKSSSLDPFISLDGKQLYFSSDREGGEGGFDLYVSNFEDGKWSDPINVRHLNSPGDEKRPTVFNGKIYFSSNGLPGLGGLDLFSASIHHVEEAVNMGYPINTSYDEERITFIDSVSGYFSSNRHGGYDVFRFDHKPAKVQLSGFILHAATGLRFSGVTVFLEQSMGDENWKVVETIKTNHTGVYHFSVKPNRVDYRLRFWADGCKEVIQVINTNEVNYSKEEKPIRLEPVL